MAERKYQKYTFCDFYGFIITFLADLYTVIKLRNCGIRTSRYSNNAMLYPYHLQMKSLKNVPSKRTKK